MHIISLKAISINPDRVRRIFDEERIQELAADIAQNGLYNPIVVKRNTDETCTLVQGERRFRAVSSLAEKGTTFRHNQHTFEPGTIPATFLDEIDETTALALEIAENVLRVDLSWQERADGYARLAALRRAQAEAEGRRFHLTQLAEEVLGDAANQFQNQQVRNAVLLAEHLSDPDIAKAKTQQEALKILERKKRDLLTNTLAAKLSNTESNHTCINANFVEWVREVADETFDIIIADPPYGINAHKMEAQSGTIAGIRHLYEDTPDYADAFMSCLSSEGFRITRPDAHAYIFCDIRNFHKWADTLSHVGWSVWPFPLIWAKGNAGNLIGNCNGPRHCYEAIIFATKGNKLVNAVFQDVISIPIVTQNERLHAAEKPVELLVNLLRRSAIPGDKILDPCCGSGSIFIAATSVKATATGIEIDKTHHANALVRMHENAYYETNV